MDNKGVGPAIVRHVVVAVDRQPVRQWSDVLQKILGPGHHKFSESNLSGHVLSAGESVTVFTPRDDENQPLTVQRGGPLWDAMNNDRGRVSVEICYCSTLGDCWILRSGPQGSSTTEIGTCPGSSDKTFQQ